MNFQHFISIIPKILKSKLPGEIAHNKMAPPERRSLIKNLNFTALNPKKASVLMLFYPKYENTQLVLIKRNEYLGIHTSQISLPGGKYEDTDLTMEKTALRETFEEIGIHENKIKIIKPLTEVYIPPSNFLVFPFLGYCCDKPIFTPDRREVSEIIEVPIDSLLSDKLVVNKKMNTAYNNDIEVPSFEINNHFVWGATAMMLNELKEILKNL